MLTFIFTQWPERIPAGTRIPEVTSLLDLLPTIAQLVGDQTTSTITNPRDGISLLGAFSGDQERKRERTIFHFCDSEIFAVRRQLEDGRVYKMILQEPTLTQTGACSGQIFSPPHFTLQTDFLTCFLLHKLFFSRRSFTFIISRSNMSLLRTYHKKTRETTAL